MENNEQGSHPLIAEGSPVFDSTGEQARVLACEQRADGTLQIVLERPHGRLLKLPQQMLLPRDGGGYDAPLAFSAVEESLPPTGERYVIPVIREELQVDKQTVDTGQGVRVYRHIVERTETVDEPLWKDELDVRHVAAGRNVDSADLPVPRQEGNTFIVPVLEEVLVIERQWRLKEEVHITRHRRQVHAPQAVVLRSQQVSIERFDENTESRGTTSLSDNPKKDTNNPGKPAG